MAEMRHSKELVGGRKLEQCQVPHDTRTMQKMGSVHFLF